MSRIKPYLNRLEELFSDTDPVTPEPVNIPPAPAVQRPESIDASDAGKETVQVMYADIPGMIDRDLATVLHIGQALTQFKNLAQLLDNAAHLIADRFALSDVQIFLSEPEQRCLALRSACGSTKELSRQGYSLAIDAHTSIGIAYTTQQPVCMPDQVPANMGDCQTQFASGLALPLMREMVSVNASDPAGNFPALEGVFGVLALFSSQMDAFPSNRKLVFEILASRLAATIEQFRVGEYDSVMGEKHQRVGWDEFLDAINRKDQIGFRYEALSGETITELDTPLLVEDAETISDRVLTTRLQIGDETIGTLQLERIPENIASVDTGVSGNGTPPGFWESGEIELVKSVADRVALHLENLRLLSQAERYRSEAEEVARRLTRQGWESYLEMPKTPQGGFVYDLDMVKPLDAVLQPGNKDAAEGESLTNAFQQATGIIKVRDEQIGELEVLDTSQDDDLAAEILAVVSERLGTHIENLRLLEETERGRAQLDKRAAELETVARVSTAAATILSPQELLQSVVDLTKYSFNVYHTEIYMLDDDKSNLVLTAGAGKIGHRMVSEGEKIDLNLSDSVAARAVASRAGVILNDVRQDESYIAHPLLSNAMSEMAVPMIVGDQLIGVFHVLASEVGRFSDEDMRTYNTLASQVAVALRNAELYAEQMATVARLRELDHLKSSFLANMSHELRTPLNSILGFAQVILEGLDGPLTVDMSNDLGLIEKNGKHLLNLINEILDLAKIEAGRLSLSPEPVNLLSLIEDVVDSSASLMRDTLYLRIEHPERSDINLMLDYTRMRQVFTNLIGNASKFTEQGGLSIDFIQQSNKISIRFKDTGIGIPPNKLDMIFEQFSQVDTSTTRKAGGTGLGLPISRRLVELHGGRLWAESKGIPGEGSVFIVELPLTPVAKV